MLPDRSILRGQKLVKNCQNWNIQIDFWLIFKHCGVDSGPVAQFVLLEMQIQVYEERTVAVLCSLSQRLL